MTPGTALAHALPSGWQKGANLTNATPDQYASAASDATIARLRATGSTHAAFVPTWRMSSATSSSIVAGPTTPSDASLHHGLAEARSLGMRVVLKPHVDVDDGTWRGAISPSCRSCWWSSYRSIIYAQAELAEQAGADLLVVGTELDSMTPDVGQWRQLIAGVRRRFGGRLTYAGNNIPTNVTFWDAVDYIGADFYLPLVSDEPNPTVERLVAAWRDRGYVRDLAALQSRWRKPLIFTEIGYRSIYSATRLPWEFRTSLPSALQPQERAYEAAYRVWSRRPWFKGLYWWDWQPWGNAHDDAFTARGKPAENVMRRWNR